MSDGMKRRDFLKVLGAGGAGAATVGCSTGEVERLIPYVVPSEEIVPGVPTWYSTTCRECPAGCGLHVETHSGRTTKVEGNPDHPVSHGNTCARGQASVQGLYHPDRHRGPTLVEPGVQALDVTWGVAEKLLADRIQEIQAAGRADRIVFLTQDYSGTMDRLADDWVAAIGGRRVVYDVWQDQPRSLDFSSAEVLVSFGADFLETWGSPVDYAWQFAQMHAYRNGRRGKFVWVGPHRPLTGLNADQWIAPRPGSEGVLARALAGQVDAATAARETGMEREVIEELVREFTAGNGMALGPGSSISGANASDLRDAIDAINAGRAGSQPARARGIGREMVRLVEQMRAGEIELLLIDAPNPAYTLPGALDFAGALRNVPTRVSFSTFPDETAALCTLVLPDHHFLEKWDDYIPRPGVYDLVQPTMRPVFNTKQVGDVLLSVAARLGNPAVSAGITATTWYDYLRASWSGIAAGPGWSEAVKRGGVYQAAGDGGEAPSVLGVPSSGARAAAAAAAGVGAAVAAPPASRPSSTGFEDAGDGSFHLVVYPSYRFYHGNTANRPWLLELPDPVTKVSWQSWVEMHPEAAARMGLEQGDWVEVSSPHGSVSAPVYVYPGVRSDTVAIQTGLGHTAMGRYTEGRGVNPNVLLGAAIDERSGEFAPYSTRVSLRKTSENVPFEEKLFEQGSRLQYDRELAQAVSVAELATLERTTHAVIPGEDEEIRTLRSYGGFGVTTEHTDPAAYPQPGTHYGDYMEGVQRWAMAIDLSRCIGCSACVVACYAENNIPVVGPKEMRRGRELSWLRIERYFGVTGHEEDAHQPEATDDVRFLPMLCQHCGNAPCEPVCPVYAAYHTPDGLNGQVYNRCVGTRYCANNCPYKVRVFNWFTYDFAEPLNWQLNPDVTVREKGVMEKCTFCVQRIREKERGADLENRAVADGEVVPACVQTCPTEVFVFGNIADPGSDVAQAARSVRGYRVLDLLNTQPAIVYLKKVTLEEPARGGHHAAAAGGEHAAPAAGH
jgi:anaerobic selenocysteine-containing dehydrogenase/Fe-S-cluster-containing dehydrogenase component